MEGNHDFKFRINSVGYVILSHVVTWIKPGRRFNSTFYFTVYLVTVSLFKLNSRNITNHWDDKHPAVAFPCHKTGIKLVHSSVFPPSDL